MEEISAEDLSCTPPDVAETAKMVTLNLLPQKSRLKYEKAYTRFVNWCNSKKVSNYSENVLLAYFSEESKNYKSSSMWSHYSMIKSCLQVKNKIDISKYNRLIAFLKRSGEGYRPKKSKVLSREQIMTFIEEAPDDTFLAIKVSLILGLAGACRREELCNLCVEDIEDAGSALIVNIRTSKTKIERVFTVVDKKEEAIKFTDIVRKYASLRPSHIKHSRFFLFYKNGKCSTQVIGKNTMGSFPSRIATYLKLPEPKTFTGHCFRRSSATLLADGGADLTVLKRHGGWRSSTVAEGYIDESIENKIKIGTTVLHGEVASTSVAENINVLRIQENTSNKTQFSENNIPSITVSNCSSSHVNITLNIK